MSELTPPNANWDNLNSIADAFVSARKTGKSLSTYPGDLPATLEESYSVQDKAIELWGEPVAGWKVGRIPDHYLQPLGMHRLAGPIFKSQVWYANTGTETESNIFKGGFAAVEAEFLLVVGEDAPADKTVWTIDEAKLLISEARIGVEIASSPYARINEDGPTCVVSDFGNNAGLIVGPVIEGWKNRPYDEWVCETIVNGVSVGTGNGNSIPDSPFESARFLLELSAKRGMPLKKGCIISSGAATGIHDIVAGDKSIIRFGSDGELRHLANWFPEL